MEVADSVNKIPIRLTDERWVHIVENHDELAGMVFDVLETISSPDFVAAGWTGECLAARKLNKKHTDKKEKNFMADTILKESIRFLPLMKRLPSQHIWFDYDKEADVLYVSLEKPQRVTDTEVFKDGVLMRRRGKKIVGFTILNASRV